MPQDLLGLQAAAGGYRRAVEQLGVEWPEPEPGELDPPSSMAGYYAIDAVPEEILWLHSFVRAGEPVLPEGFLLPWPDSAEEALGVLELAWPVPFRWRQQIPVFDFDEVVFTLVVDGDRAGEVWRYEIGEDAYAAVRAAPSLTAVFENWGRIASGGGLIQNPDTGWVQLRSTGVPEQEFLRDVLRVDPFAYPTAPLDQQALRQRQRESGVDMDVVEDFDAWNEATDEVAAIVASLDG